MVKKSLEMYFQNLYFKFVFHFKSDGISSCIPSSLRKKESIKFGKIITHYFVQFNIFPTGFSKAIIEYIIFDKVCNEVLQESICRNHFTIISCHMERI